jgi:hypothetical protein
VWCVVNSSLRCCCDFSLIDARVGVANAHVPARVKRRHVVSESRSGVVKTCPELRVVAAALRKNADRRSEPGPASASGGCCQLAVTR